MKGDQKFERDSDGLNQLRMINHKAKQKKGRIVKATTRGCSWHRCHQ